MGLNGHLGLLVVTAMIIPFIDRHWAGMWTRPSSCLAPSLHCNYHKSPMRMHWRMEIAVPPWPNIQILNIGTLCSHDQPHDDLIVNQASPLTPAPYLAHTQR